MTDELVITHLDVVPDSADRSVRGRAERVLSRMVPSGLERAVRAEPFAAGEWCVREVSVTAPAGPGQSEVSLSNRWAGALVAAVHRTIAEGGDGVVQYRDHRDALVDLVGSLAADNESRSWAWRQLGLVDRVDQTLSPPGPIVVEALRRHPTSALGVIVDVVGAVGFAALDRVLGVDGWGRVAELVLTEHGSSIELLTVGAEADGATGLRVVDEVRDRAVGDERTSAPAVEPGRTATDVIVRSRLAAALARTPFRLDAERRRSLAVLCLAELDPAALARVDRGRTMLTAIEELLSSGPTPIGAMVRPSDSGAVERHAPFEADLTDLSHGDRSDLAAEPEFEVDEDAGRTEDEAGHPTEWAGLLFLLGLIEPLLPDLDAALAVRPLRWVLHHVAGRLVPVPEDDPARRAFCGLVADGPGPDDGSPGPTQVEKVAIEALAAELRSTITAFGFAEGQGAARSIGEAGTGGDPVLWVCRRPGLVVADPGWIEVQLPLSSLDVEIRAMGLDLDPDWVSWLGAVVRFVYV